MKIKIVILFLILHSCSEIEKKDIIGNWNYNTYDNYFPSYWELKITNDCVYTVDNYGYIDKFDYKLSKNNLIINSWESDTILEVKRFSFDSIRVGNRYFDRINNNISIKENFYYPLIGIETSTTVKHLNSNSYIVHLWRNDDNLIKIRIGDKYFTLSQLKYCVGYHDTSPNFLFFIGKDVSLKFLKQVHLELQSLNIRNVAYVLSKKYPEGYSIFEDNLFYWNKELEDYYKEKRMPQPPPPPYRAYSELFFKASGGTVININATNEIDLLDSIYKEGEYVIQISDMLSFEEYISIKKKIVAIKQKGISGILATIIEVK